MAITINHLIQEARAQGGPSRLTVNGREFKVEIIHGRPHVSIDRRPETAHSAQAVLTQMQLVAELDANRVNPISPSLYVQQVGRVTRQPRNEAEVHEHIGRLITELAPMLENLAEHYDIAQAPTAAKKIRQLLHLNDHGTFPLASD